MSYFRRSSDPHIQPLFPTFLSPSIPFRRKSRQSSTDSNDSTTSATSNTSALSAASSATTLSTGSLSSNPFFSQSTTATLPDSDTPVLPPTDKLLYGHSSRLHCAKCSTDLCLTSQIISKGFTGRHGRAYLVQGSPSHTNINVTSSTLPNTYQNKAVPRNLVTGQHTVSDISCAICGTVLGWKYVEASEESQKYKVGKFILETRRIRVGVCWENLDDVAQGRGLGPINETVGEEVSQPGEPIDFDSQDEDECEDLFAGVWSPKLAQKRKQRKSRFLGRGRTGISYGGGGSSSSGGRARSEDILS